MGPKVIRRGLKVRPGVHPAGGGVGHPGGDWPQAPRGRMIAAGGGRAWVFAWVRDPRDLRMAG